MAVIANATITKVFYRPDEGYGFDFESADFRFKFYARVEIVGENQQPVVDVHSIDIFSPRPPTESGRAEIENCIRYYFETIESASKPTWPHNPLPKVTFSWEFSRTKRAGRH